MSSKNKPENPRANHLAHDSGGAGAGEDECIKTGVSGRMTEAQLRAATDALVEEVMAGLEGRPFNAERLNGSGEVIMRSWMRTLFPVGTAPRRGENAFRPQEAGLLEAGIDVVQGRRDRTAMFFNVNVPPAFEATLAQIHAQRVFVRTARAYADNGDAHVWTGELLVHEVVNDAWSIMAPVFDTNADLVGTYGAFHGYKIDRVRKAQDTKADHRRLEAAWERDRAEEFERAQREGVRQEMAGDLASAIFHRVGDSPGGGADDDAGTGTGDRRGGGRGV